MQAKAASSTLYFTQLNSELAIRGWEVLRGRSCCFEHFYSGGRVSTSRGRNLPARATQRGKGMSLDGAASLIPRLWTGLPTPGNKGNQTLALRRENLLDCFMLNSNPTPRSCFFISQLLSSLTSPCLYIPQPISFYLLYRGQSLPLPVRLQRRISPEGP